VGGERGGGGLGGGGLGGDGSGGGLGGVARRSFTKTMPLKEMGQK